LWTIDLAPSSIAAFNNLVNTIRDQLGKLPLQIQVTIDFDPNADYPKLTFADPEPLPEKLIEMMFELRKASQSSLEKEPGT
jgi:hypothetical protein